MPEIHFHRSVDSFWKRNKDYCNRNYYAVESLWNMVNWHKAGHEKVKITAAFNIEGSDVFGLWSAPSLMIYGTQFDEPIINELIRGIDPGKMDHASVTGQRELVLGVLKQVKNKKTIISERNVYECKEVRPLKVQLPGEMLFADMNDIDTLSEMSFQFQKEEYGDRLEKNIDEMRNEVVIPAIRKQNLLKWVDKGVIKSILQVSISDVNAPSIMHFFTKEEVRKQGYGYALAWHATNDVLFEYESCGLVTKRNYIPSNKTFQNVGYEKVYDWIKVIVEPARQ